MTGVNFNYGINTDKERADLLEYERMALNNAFCHHNERCVPVFYDALDYITRYSPGVWGKIDRVLMGMDDHPQPVNLTPAALGVRMCE